MPNNIQIGTPLCPADADDPILNSNIKFSYPESMPTDDSESTKTEKIHWLMSKAYEIPVNDIEHAPLALRYLCEALYLKTGKRDFSSCGQNRYLDFSVAERASAIFKKLCIENYRPEEILNQNLIHDNWRNIPTLAVFIGARPYRNAFEPLYLYTKSNQHLYTADNGSIHLDTPELALRKMYEANSRFPLTFFRENSGQAEAAPEDAEPFDDIHSLLDSDNIQHSSQTKMRALIEAQIMKRELNSPKRYFTYKNTGFDNGKNTITFNTMSADFYINMGKYSIAEAYLGSKPCQNPQNQSPESRVVFADGHHFTLQGRSANYYKKSILAFNNAHRVAEPFYGLGLHPLERGINSHNFLLKFPEYAIIDGNDNPTEDPHRIPEEQRRETVFLLAKQIADAKHEDSPYLTACFLKNCANSYDEYLLLCKALYCTSISVPRRSYGYSASDALADCKKCDTHTSRSGAYAIEAFLEFRSRHPEAAMLKANFTLALCGNPETLDEPAIVTERNARLASFVKMAVLARAKAGQKDTPLNYLCDRLLFEPESSLNFNDKNPTALFTMPNEHFLNSFQTELQVYLKEAGISAPLPGSKPKYTGNEITNFSKLAEDTAEPTKRTGITPSSTQQRETNIAHL